MKKLKYLLIATIGVLAVTVSCNDDFLLKEPQGSIAGPSLANADGVKGKLIAAYRTLSGQGMNGGGTWYYDIHGWIFGGIASDNGLKGTDAGDQPEHSFIEQYAFTSFNVHIKDKWRSVYWGMSRANDVIDSAAEAEDLTPAEATQIVAEARFLRGFHGLEAQKHFRNPSYVDDAAYDLNDVESSKVPNAGPIWDQIIADFTAAAAALPGVQPEVGRASSWAAKAFLAKTLMYSGDAGNIAKALPIMEDIVNNGPFSLTAKYEENFLVAHRNNDESIFEIQYAISSGDDQNSNKGVGLAHPYISPWGCCGFYQAPQDLVDFFQTDVNGLPLLDESWKTKHITNPTGDIASIGQVVTGTDPSVDARLDHTLGRPGILYKGFHIMQVDYVRDITYAGPYFSKKHVAEPEAFGTGGWGNLSANNYRIMRLAHVKLWLAEAYVAAGRISDAMEQVNHLRARAANPEGFVPGATQGATRGEFDLTGTPGANYNVGQYEFGVTFTAANAQRAVRYESRLETAMEGHRFFDLQRWGVMKEVLTDYLTREGKFRIYLAGKSFTSPKNQYYPIPQEAIDRSFVEGAPTLTQDPNY